MATPVIETIAVAIQTALEEITTANDYNYDVTDVVRPTRAGITPKHGTCILEQGTKRRSDDTAHMMDEWIVPFYATLYTRPSDTATTALDTLGNQWGADIEKAVKANGAQFATGVMDSWISESAFIESDDGAMDGVQAEFLVVIEHQINDPYTARGA